MFSKNGTERRRGDVLQQHRSRSRTSCSEAYKRKAFALIIVLTTVMWLHNLTSKKWRRGSQARDSVTFKKPQYPRSVECRASRCSFERHFRDRHWCVFYTTLAHRKNAAAAAETAALKNFLFFFACKFLFISFSTLPKSVIQERVRACSSKNDTDTRATWERKKERNVEYRRRLR